MSVQLIRGDATALPIAGGSVDLVVTSPPYYAVRSYQDGGEHYAGQIGDEATPTEFVDSLIDATREMVRVLKPSGSIWVNLSDTYSRGQARSGIPNKSLMGAPWRYALRCIDDLGLILRAEIVWSKPNGMPEAVTDRVRRSHETWFHFTKESRYFAAVDELREPHVRARTKLREPGTAPAPWGRGGKFGEIAGYAHNRGNPLGALPGSVWSIPTEPLTVSDHLGVDHYAAFPMEWPRRLITGWSPPGGVVLDPFGGTGTTAVVADALGRQGISVDMSADYLRIARWRTTDPKQRAKAAQTPYTPPVPQLAGQVAFDFQETG